MSQERCTNLDYLLEITGGEAEVMKEFIQMFFDQLVEFRTGMTANLEAKKWKEAAALLPFFYLRVSQIFSKHIAQAVLRSVFCRFGVSLTLRLFQISGDRGD